MPRVKVHIETDVLTEAKARIGIDADKEVLAAAAAAGVPLTFRELKITAAALPCLRDIFAECEADVLIARRVLPELFSADLTAGQRFVAMLADVGVKEIFLEGRVSGVKSVNTLRSVAEEVDLLAPWFREVRRAGALSHLAVR